MTPWVKCVSTLWGHGSNSRVHFMGYSLFRLWVTVWVRRKTKKYDRIILMKYKEKFLISCEIRNFLVETTGLEKEELCFAQFNKTLQVLVLLRFLYVVFFGIPSLVVVSRQNNDQITTIFHACFLPNFTGSASARASAARACAVSKVWA